MILEEKISTLISQHYDVEFSKTSIENALICSQTFSDELNTLFLVMTSSSAVNNIIEFYYDDELIYIDISFDNISSASIYFKKRTRGMSLEKQPYSDLFLDNVPIADIFEIVQGFMSFRKI